MDQLGQQIEQLQGNLNYLWVLVAAGMVFIMQAGFMCLESGLSRAKNSINVAVKNLADFSISVIGFWLIGFGLMFGESVGGWIGSSHFMLSTEDNWTIIFFVFQSVFCGTVATIDSGAIAERAKFRSYLVISAIISFLVYPIFGHWAWGSLLLSDNQGWLEKMGFMDFAGSTVVHSVGGWVALAGLIVIGPRTGKFENGKVNKIHPSNLALTYLGVFILTFGWFGFNCGSTLTADSSIAPIALNTVLAACFGCIGSSAVSWITSRQNLPEADMIANGVIGGLVGITAGCAAVTPAGAAVIGLSSGVLLFFSIYFLEHILKLDDVVGAVAAHGFCGAWGTIAVGIFATDAALGGTPRLEQIMIQALGAVVAFIWAFGVSFIILKIVDGMMGLRVSVEEEEIGLNIAEHGAKSSVVELLTSMRTAINEKRYDESLAVEEEHGTEIGDLAKGFNQMLKAVETALTEANSQKSSAATHQEKAEKSLEEVNSLMAKLKTQQSDSEDQRSKYLTEVTSKLELIIDKLKEIFGNIESSSSEVNSSLNGLLVQSTKIHESVKVIEEIVLATKLLSFNASLEAERAGEHGKGFMVVAGEVGKLSLNTNKSLVEIEKIVQFLDKQIKKLSEQLKSQSNLIKNGTVFVKDIQEISADLSKDTNSTPNAYRSA